ALRGRRTRRPCRRLPGRALELRRRRPPLPARLREPAARCPAQPFRAAEAVRPQPAQRVVGARQGAWVRGAARQVSLRNRELANLIVVGMLTVIGFASVYIARQAVVSTGSLAYAGFFFAL